MNTKLEEYKNYIKDKKVAVIGVGVSNIPISPVSESAVG